MRPLICLAAVLFVAADRPPQAPPVRPEPAPAVRPDPQIVPASVPAPVMGHWEYRNPVGHTHTCANGHTWDHQQNPGHTCQVCGAQQYVQDTVPRKVGVWVAGTSPSPTDVPVAAPYRAPATTYSPPGTYSLTGGSGGCPNGNCPATTRRGIFR